MRSRRLRDDRGAAAVELALVLPILVVLLFGMVEFSLAYNTLTSLNHAAREGVRELAVTRDGAKALTAAAGALDTVSASKVQFTASTCTDGLPATVTATYSFDVQIPLFPKATIPLTGRGVMRCGG